LVDGRAPATSRVVRAPTVDAQRRFVADKRVIRLCNPREVRRFLRDLPDIGEESRREAP